MCPTAANGAGSRRSRRDMPCARVAPGLRLMRAYAAAAQTVSLVLDEDAPLPDTDRDVDGLVHRLRGHVLQLGPVVSGNSPVLRHAQQMSACPIPAGYVPSRVYLVRLAEAVGQLAETARLSGQASSAGQARWRRPSRTAVRLAVFALALGTVIIGGSAPRDAVTQTTTGSAVWLAVIVSALALLLALALRPSPTRPGDDTGEGLPAAGKRTQHDSALGQDTHRSPTRPSADALAHYRERPFPLRTTSEERSGGHRPASHSLLPVKGLSPSTASGERPR